MGRGPRLGVELRAGGEERRCAHLGDRELTQFVGVIGHRVAQLAQAAHAGGEVGGPVRVVEGPARRADRGIHVGRARVGGLAHLLLGGGVDRGERGPRLRRHQLAVDQQHIETFHQFLVSLRQGSDPDPQAED
jgi:hypothetical protein